MHTAVMLRWDMLGVVMGKVDSLERQLQALSPEEFAQIRAWFLEFDWTMWDRLIEHDVRAGKLDALANRARRDHASGAITLL